MLSALRPDKYSCLSDRHTYNPLAGNNYKAILIQDT